MNRIAHIDGLRAVAVIAVLLFHVGLPPFSGGFVGVDVFFVISGYVITRMIVRDLDERKFSFLQFYLGRARRLLPALLVTVAISGAAAAFMMTPAHLQEFAGSVNAAILAWSNIYFWKLSDYFDTSALTKPLLHTWTLSVEWQFYLMWPALLAAAALTGRFAALLLAAGGVASLAAGVIWRSDPSVVFYWMPFRMFEFILGALVLWLPKMRSNPLREVGTATGFALIGLSVFMLGDKEVFSSIKVLLPASGAALIIWLGAGSRIGSLIDNSVAAYVGRISYSIYLIHWPIIVFYTYFVFHPLSTLEAIVICGLSIMGGAAMYHSVELPFWRGRALQKSALLIASASVVLVLAFYSATVDGWKTRIDPATLAKFENPERFHVEQYGGEGFSANEVIRIGDGHASYVIAGDSHALHFAFGLDEESSGVALFDHGCFIAPGITRYGTTENDSVECLKEYPRLRDLLAGNLLPLVLAYNWPGYKGLIGPAGDGPVLFKTDEDYADYLMGLVMEILKDVGDRDVILIGTVPGSGEGDGAAACLMRPTLARQYCQNELAVPVEDGNGRKLNVQLKAFADRVGIGFVDPYDWFCADGLCMPTKGDDILYSDSNHLSKAGSKVAAQSLVPRLASAREIAARPSDPHLQER